MATTALRGLELLEVLAGMRQPAALADVAARVGLSESQTFRVLQALEKAGYLDHLGRSGYRLGSRAVALSTVIGPRPALLRAIYPVVTRLAHLSGEAAVVHLRAGHSRVLVLGVPGRGPMRDPAAVLGERSPLAVGASGRVILAHLPPSERVGLDVAGLDLDAVRERGYETSFGENHPGVNGVSVALVADDVALGSVTLAGPSERLPEAALVRLVPRLTAACRELSPRLASLLGPQPGATIRALDL